MAATHPLVSQAPLPKSRSPFRTPLSIDASAPIVSRCGAKRRRCLRRPRLGRVTMRFSRPRATRWRLIRSPARAARAAKYSTIRPSPARSGRSPAYSGFTLGIRISVARNDSTDLGRFPIKRAEHSEASARRRDPFPTPQKSFLPTTRSPLDKGGPHRQQDSDPRAPSAHPRTVWPSDSFRRRHPKN